MSEERQKAAQAEVRKLLDAGVIREVQYPEWLVNVVMVPKKNEKWRMCIDFTILNKACPPTTKKGVQKLTGRLASLNRFISRSTEK